MVSRGDSGDGVAPLVELLQAVERRLQKVIQRRQRVRGATLSHVKHQLFGLVQRGCHIIGQAIAKVGDFLGYSNEAAQQGVLFHDAGVLTCVGCGGRTSLERHQQGRAPNGVEEIGAPQLLGHGDEIDGLTTSIERHDRLEHVAVGWLVEVGGGGALQSH